MTRLCPTRTPHCCRPKLLKHATLKIYPGYPHGMMTTNADVINADLLEFIRE